MPFSRGAWDDRENRIALIDLMTDEALFTIDAAYHELGAITRRLSEEAGFLQQLARDGGKLGRLILDTRVHPAIEHLHAAVAGTEVLELAALGQLEEEAKRTQREDG